MALNPFFLHGSKGEQNLVQDLINEQLRMYGVEIYYIPRRYLSKKTVIREVIQSEFKDAYPIEAYVSSYNAFEGQGTILSKFGVQDLDDLTLVISKERFETYIFPLMEYQNIPNLELKTRPKEGDLVWFPLGDRLFEIKFVEHEVPFYQLGKNYVYELKCELYRYSNEELDTNLDFIDDNVEDQGYNKTFTLVGSGTTATAYTGLVSGAVYQVLITRRGSGFTAAPTVVFEKSPVSGGTASAEAVLIDGLVDCNGTTSSKVQTILITNPGFGYTYAPKVIVTGGGGGTGFAATTRIGNGVVGVVTITNGGSSYILGQSPNVAITTAPSGSGNVSAAATAVVSTASTISRIKMINSGVGYTQTPTVTIGPPVLIGSGTYQRNEVVVGSSSSATAKVNSWNITTKKIELNNITGTFIAGETLTGQTSGASYKISYSDEFDITDTFAQNDEIQIESDKILDFSEVNPFGTV
jgi:hypothetical protein